MTARYGTAMVITVVSVVVAAIGVALVSVRASAVFEEIIETGRPGYLVLRADSETPLWTTLAPGETARWLVEAELGDADRGAMSLELRSSGALVEPGGLTAEVVGCSGRADLTTSPPSCAGERETVVPETPLHSLPADGTPYELAALERDAPRQLLVTLRLPEDAEVEADQLAHVGLGVHVAGDDAAPTPSRPPGKPPLAVTGADAVPLLLVALGLAGIAAGSAGLRRARAIPPPGEESR